MLKKILFIFLGFVISFSTFCDDDMVCSYATIGDLNGVKDRIRSGISPNYRCCNGCEGLISLPVTYGFQSIIQYLIEQGADVNLANGEGCGNTTPLLVASNLYYSGLLDVIKLLVEYGADVNAKQKFYYVNNTALHFASTQGSYDVVTYLCDNGANPSVNATNEEGRIPLHMASASDIGKGTLDIIKYFIEVKGVDVNVKDYQDHTPLLLASNGDDNTNLDMIKYFISKGADIKARDYQGNNALLVAAWNAHYTNVSNVSIITFLLEEARIDVNSINKKGETALIRIVKNTPYGASSELQEKDINIIKILIKYGANKSLKDNDGNTVMDIAKEKNLGEIINYLQGISIVHIK